jgi:CBS domain-containing protein
MGFFDFLSKKPSNNVGFNLKVKEIMTPNPIVVSGTATIAQIEEIFSKNSIWSIYVGDPDNYIGIITRDDLKFRVKNKSKSSPAYSIMSKGVFSIDENADVEEARTFLYKKKLNGLAVTRDGKHCGIITRYDIKNKQSRSYDFSQEETPQIVPPSPSPLPPSNDGQNWTNDDIQLLRQSWGEGKSIEIIANLLDRSPDAVVHKLIDTGLIGYNDDNCDPKPARFGLTWSDHERAQLISESNAGKSISEIANIHQRNKNTILHNLIKIKIINYIDRSILEELSDTSILIRTLISELENNSNIDFRNSAATQLGSFHEPSVVNALIKCVKNDPRVRYRALAALRNIGDPQGIPVFIERLKDRSLRIRLVSVNALGELGDSNVVQHLKSHIKSKDYQNALKNGGNPEIIQAAREAIQKIHSREQLPVDEKPELTIYLDRTQLSAERSHKLGITLTNTGNSPVENVILTFSNEFETKGIKPISVKSGQSSRMDISIFPKTVGNILLEITLTYKDIKGRENWNVQEFWIDVVEKGTTPSPSSETPSIIHDPITPKILTLKQLPSELSDRYPESEFIGKGGFARVFKAKRKDGQYVAVKIPISMDAMTGKSFIAEMQNWTKLSHPNIVRLYDFNIMPMPYFEEELCDSALADQNKPLECEKAAWILFNICEGLKFAHTQKIIHRDLKPQNILLKKGLPKISDWGLSRIISESTRTMATSFTPSYAAPEQINNRVKDERTDIWQLGVILYELITGVLPFNGDSMVEIGMNIATNDPKRPGEIISGAQAMEAVVMKCLEKDPTKRYQSVLELQKDLAMYLRGNYTELLKMSVTAHDNNQSAFYCGDLVMVNLLTGDMKSAYKYLLDLVQYSRSDV